MTTTLDKVTRRQGDKVTGNTFSPHHPITPSPRHRITTAPLRTVSPGEHSQRLALRGFVDCPQCGKTFMQAAVVVERQEPIDEPLCGYTGPCQMVSLYCDHCDQLYTRLRACDQRNHPGDWIGSYGVIRSRSSIDKFLTLHPEAKGVEQ